MKLPEALEIPQAVLDADQKAELARIWLADGYQVVVLSPHLWHDPGAWGLMLVDFAKHVANAYEATGVPYAFVMQRIRAAAEAEWAHATGIPPDVC